MLEVIGWSLLALGLPAVVAASVADPAAARSAAAQAWPPFVLVAGLLGLGLVAGRDGLFDAAGSAIARLGRSGLGLLASAAVLVSVVTAVLNLDTAVTFLTPVLVLAARRRGTAEAPFLYLAVFLANGASLLLPGSNLTNLIVLGPTSAGGTAFAARMLPAFVASVLCITALVALIFRRSLLARRRPDAAPAAAPAPAPARMEAPVPAPARMRPGLSMAGVAVAVVAMLVLPSWSAALVVLATGAVVVLHGWLGGRVAWPAVRRAVNVPILAGLFSVAVAMGVLGRVWSGPAQLLAHGPPLTTAVTGALASVAVNNLPAASLLGARPVADPSALLVGLDLGPNLFVTGALSAVLWWQVARPLNAHTSVRRFARLGLVITPLSMAAALGALALFG